MVPIILGSALGDMLLPPISLLFIRLLAIMPSFLQECLTLAFVVLTGPFGVPTLVFQFGDEGWYGDVALDRALPEEFMHQERGFISPLNFAFHRRDGGFESFEVKILILAMCVKCNEAVSVFLERGTEMDVNGARRKLQHAKQHDFIDARRSPFTILAQFLSSLLSLTTEFRYSELVRRTVYDFKQRCLCESQCDHIDHIVRVPFSVVC